ncbi:MAG: hypothetical protein ABH879_08255 [archaeon]
MTIDTLASELLFYLKPSDVRSRMVSWVEKHLFLNQIEIMQHPVSSPVMTFTGKDNEGISFALEVVVNTESVKAMPHHYLDARLQERSSPRLRKNRTYTAVLFPKSLDLATSNPRYEGRYFRQAHLLGTADESAARQYRRFSHYDVKHLSDIEWRLALPLGGQQLNYYNASLGCAQVHTFQSFRRDQVIPDNIPSERAYFWKFARADFVPHGENMVREAEVFAGIQTGLHDRVRRIIRTRNIGYFTLMPYGKAGARLSAYKT